LRIPRLRSMWHNESMKKHWLFSLLLAGSLLASCSLINNSSQPATTSEPAPTTSESIPPATSLAPGTYDPTTDYGGYYASLTSWTNGEDLKSKLHAIISGGTYTPITYAGTIANWQSNQKADQDLYDHEMVDVVYSPKDELKTGTNTYWQREHAWPASLMTGSTTSTAVKHLGRATDFHNLFAGSSNGNTSRGNKNYGTANKSASSYTNNKVGDDGYSYDSTWFEPGDHDKGRVSRAIFYMATMYCEEDYDDSNAVTMAPLTIVEESVDYKAGNSCEFAIGGLSSLLEWSKIAVDLAEVQHNESVYSFVPQVHSTSENNAAQGNRNPYVDYPDLVDYVFGSKKNEGGTLSAIEPTCHKLNLGKGATLHYAIDTAKRQYDEGEVFHKSDINVVAVNDSFAETATTDFTVEGATDGSAINASGNTEITVKTAINDIKYGVKVETDPVMSALWNHKVTGKASGNDFNGIDDKAGQDNELTFDGVTWIVRWNAGKVGSTNAKLGAAFGTSTAPVGTLKFETKEAFSYSGKSNVTAVYIRGAAASGCSYNVSIKVGSTSVTSGTLGYIDTSTPLTFGSTCSSLTGKVTIEITNITKAVYIQYLAVNAE